MPVGLWGLNFTEYHYHAWRPANPQTAFSGGFHDSYGIYLPPYQNAIGERGPRKWPITYGKSLPPTRIP